MRPGIQGQNVPDRAVVADHTTVEHRRRTVDKRYAPVIRVLDDAMREIRPRRRIPKTDPLPALIVRSQRRLGGKQDRRRLGTYRSDRR